MQGQGHYSLLAFGDRFASRFVSANAHHGDLARKQCGTCYLIEKRKINFFDYLEYSFSLKWRTVQALLDLGQKLSVECFGFQSLQLLAPPFAYAHQHTSSHLLGGHYE